MTKLLMFLFWIILISIFSSIHAQIYPHNTEFNIVSNDNRPGFGWQPRLSELSDSGFVVCFKTDLNYINCKIYDSKGNLKYPGFQVSESPAYPYVVYNDVSALNNGSFVVSWQNFQNSLSNVITRIVKNNSDLLSDEIQLNSIDQEATFPYLCSLRDSGFVISWTEFEEGTSYFDSSAINTFKNDGSKLNEFKREGKFIEALASTSDGGFIIVWDVYSENEYTIFFQRFDSNGLEHGFPNEIGSSEGNSRSYYLSSISDSTYVLCYTKHVDYFGIYAIIFHQNGTIIKPEFKVNNQGFSVTGSRICKINDGKFVIIWDDYENQDVYCQVFNATGSKYGIEFIVNNSSNSHNPDIISFTENGFLISYEYWEEGNQGIFSKYYLNEELNHDLIPFSLRKPPQDSTLEATTSFFEWQKPITDNVNFPWEIKYTLFIDDNDSFSSATVIDSIFDSTFKVKNLNPGTTYFWKVLAKNLNGDSLWSSESYAFFVSHNATSLNQKHVQPEKFSLEQNYPNPFNPVTAILFKLGKSSKVEIDVFDSQGKLIKNLVNEHKTAGKYSAIFDGTNIASGIYYYRIKTKYFVDTKKMLLIK